MCLRVRCSTTEGCDICSRAGRLVDGCSHAAGRGMDWAGRGTMTAAVALWAGRVRSTPATISSMDPLFLQWRIQQPCCHPRRPLSQSSAAGHPNGLANRVQSSVWLSIPTTMRAIPHNGRLLMTALRRAVCCSVSVPSAPLMGTPCS